MFKRSLLLPEIRSNLQGKGQPIVFLHAFPLSHELFEDWQGPQGFQLILPDFPGFGSSPVFPEEMTLYQAAQGLAGHLNHLHLDRKIILGGISMGGYWAFEFLRLFPERVQKLILVSTRPGVDKPEGRQNRLNMAEKVLREGTEFMVEAMTPGLLGKTTLSQGTLVSGRLAQWIRATKPEAVATAQRAMAQRRDQTELLKTLTVPTLILAGQEDSLIPASEAQAMSELIPGAQLEVIEKVGHLIPTETPEGFKNSLENFVRA